MDKRIKIALGAIVLISLFLNLYKFGAVPPCFNADEAAFSYNAWSILKTGKDEHGNLLPLRLNSYGDYKLPLLTYFTIPFVGVFGLNETGARLPNTLLAGLFPIVIFFLVKELFGKNRIALLSALLVSTSVGMLIVGKHLHEAYLAAFLVSCTWLFYLRTLRKTEIFNISLTATFIFLSLFTYHSSRIFALAFLFHAIWAFGIKKKENGQKVILALVVAIAIFGITDVIVSPARVKNLIFFNNPGYVAKIQQLREEGGLRPLYNKLTPGVKDIFIENLKYFSPQYLLQNGDENFRFGHPGMGIMTIAEYLLFFVGLYYLFTKKHKFRWLIALLLFVSPLPASLSWAGSSLTRSLFLLIPILIVASYGFFSMEEQLRKNKLQRKLFIGGFIMLQLLTLYYTLDFYFHHYPKRAAVIISWQCGYKDVGEYIKENYNRYNKFYITQEYGQPYMFVLFYTQYPPEKFQGTTKRTPPDEYGFTQVQGFDKFFFEFPDPKKGENAAFIGLPANDFESRKDKFPNVESSKEIKYSSEEIFGIYDNAKMNK